jgi:small subunit ribosomal protein S17
MNKRRRLTGFVVGNKMQKTVTVEVGRTYRHRLYKKVVSSKKRYMVHDEIGCQLGDQVRIVESKPISKNKRWVVEAVLTSDVRAQDEGEIVEDVEL